MSKNTKEILSITLRLLVICAVVATIIAFVNAITKDKIEYNERIGTAQALTGIYSADYNGRVFEVDGNEYVIKDETGVVVKCIEAELKEFIRADITAMYILQDASNNPLGYCVAIQPMGFKDVIKMLVAVNPDFTVKGVKIISMSETSGIGTKAQDEGFLHQFTQMPAKEVDTISGATKTTKPVIDAVDSSVDQVKAYMNISGGATNE